MTFPGLDRIEALARNLDGWQRELASRMTELEQSSAEGVSDSGLVRVTAGADGKILSSELDARAMRLDSYTLAEEFTAAANRAQEAAAARVRDLVGEVVGDRAAGQDRPAGRSGQDPAGRSGQDRTAGYTGQDRTAGYDRFDRY
ncbi:YbaB/EbfC family nucleoid-associated protein [Micromonospora rubida]|uniref:YbaB/EbfC family nucleoid-associated protein n=1 Tax=Micromonospora rubida TaxID=2697657 RepID=UPI0013784F6A|nr:YbaB/EbfC family nucleoid-associated protein [Micromonospora rubida]NBE82679.1 YbaB/EbfC family DNA-binding protein [Micromonospora rubida]